MRMQRAAVVFGLALGVYCAPLPAHGQQAAVPTRPPHIEATQTFRDVGTERWETCAPSPPTRSWSRSAELLRPPASCAEIRRAAHAAFPRAVDGSQDGKITGVKVDELALKRGDTEMRGPGTIELAEDNGMFRVTGVTATPRDSGAR